MKERAEERESESESESEEERERVRYAERELTQDGPNPGALRRAGPRDILHRAALIEFAPICHGRGISVPTSTALAVRLDLPWQASSRSPVARLRVYASLVPWWCLDESRPVLPRRDTAMPLPSLSAGIFPQHH